MFGLSGPGYMSTPGVEVRTATSEQGTRNGGNAVLKKATLCLSEKGKTDPGQTKHPVPTTSNPPHQLC